MIAPSTRRSPGAPKQSLFLSQRFQRFEGEKAAPGPLPRLEEPALAGAGAGVSQ